MLTTLKRFDALLRGDLGFDSEKQEFQFPIFRIVLLSILMAMIFGASIGSFTAVSAPKVSDGLSQLLASTVKAPLLFYLTLIVTFPSLYVFNALMGSRLNVTAALGLLIAAITVMVTILASLGPIIVFFAFSTPAGNSGYRFILLLVVVLSAGSGILGLNYLLRMLNRYAADRSKVVAPPILEQMEPNAESTYKQLTDRNLSRTVATDQREIPSAGTGTSATAIFRVWVFVFSVVGAQMSWVLRPFVGSPDRPFSWFREREGNFFQTVFDLILQIFSGS
jgi:hypothetical protein